MHGLNTYQRLDYLAPISQNGDVGQTQAAQLVSYAVDSPGQLFLVMPNTFTNDKQFYIKRMTTKIVIHNCGMFPIMCEATWVRMRRDSTAGFFTILDEDVTGINQNIPYLSPYTGDNFRRTCKIIKQKKYIWKSGTIKRFTVRSLYAGGRAITADIEGNSAYLYRKSNMVLLIRYYGLPYIVPTTTTPIQNNGTGLTPVIVRAVQHTYVSYYTMDDAEPTSSGLTNNYGAITSAQNEYNPSYVMANYGSTSGPSLNQVPTVFASTLPA